MKKWKWKRIHRKGFFGTRQFVKMQGIVSAETLASAKRQAAEAVRKQDRSSEWRGRWYDETKGWVMYDIGHNSDNYIVVKPA